MTLRMRCGWMVAFLAGAVICSGQAEYPPVGQDDGSRRPGKFVWVDLVTDDLPVATDFYGELFGWSYHEVNGYWVAENGGHPVAGVFQRSRPADRAAKPRWFGYISVASVAQAEQAVSAAGGLIVAPPRKFPGRGEQAIFADPEGALFGVIHSETGDPEDYAVDEGDWIWMQLWSGDGGAATKFYKDVAGYEIHNNPVRGSTNDYVLASGGYARAAVLTISPDRAKVGPSWLPFVRVGQVAETVAKAERLGGKVLVAPSQALYEGHMAVVADPTGAPVGLIEWNITAPEEGE